MPAPAPGRGDARDVHVVRRELAERHWRVIPDEARRLHPVGGDPLDDAGEVHVVEAPEVEERAPVRGGISLDPDPSLLLVLRQAHLGIEDPANEAVVVVGGGIEEVPNELLRGPLAGSGSLRGALVGEGAEPGKGGLDGAAQGGCISDGPSSPPRSFWGFQRENSTRGGALREWPRGAPRARVARRCRGSRRGPGERSARGAR